MTDELRELFDSETVSDCEKALEYMRQIGGITSMDAIYTFRCTRLAARISDLRKRGYNIETVDEKNEKTKTRYARYFLRGDIING